MAQPAERNKANERWCSRVSRKTGLMNFTLRNLGVWTLRRGCCLSAASWPKTAARSGTSRIGLIFAALNGMKGWSVKKKKLFERSEFFFFSGDLLWSSGEYAALIFCFFCIKAKEKVFVIKQKEKAS